MGGRVWTLTQTEDTLWYYVYQNNHTTGSVSKMRSGAECAPEKQLKGVCSVKKEEEEAPIQDSTEEELLRDYFQLNIHLEKLYEDWGHRDTHFRHIASIFTGVRMLRQDPIECLFSFICSSNNHISRIQGMVERLCHTLGPRLVTIQDTHYHDFPPLQALADSGIEARLRELGFGYRARFLQQSAQLILDAHSPDWLQQLRSTPYKEAREALRTLPGVGLKVADCVSLMSLDKLDAVPVDTHVWQIAKRDYGFSSGNGQKTLTDKVHREIGDFFRQLWGPYAGWAHSVLFCADLKKFQNLKEQVAHVKTESLKSENGQKGKTSPKRKPSVKVNTAKKMKLEKPHIRNRTVKEEGE